MIELIEATIRLITDKVAAVDTIFSTGGQRVMMLAFSN